MIITTTVTIREVSPIEVKGQSQTKVMSFKGVDNSNPMYPQLYEFKLIGDRVDSFATALIRGIGKTVFVKADLRGREYQSKWGLKHSMELLVLDISRADADPAQPAQPTQPAQMQQAPPPPTTQYQPAPPPPPPPVEEEDDDLPF